MKTTFICLLAFTMLASSCASHKKVAQAGGTTMVASAGQDGSSYEKAVFITETSESKGVHAEYDWIAKKYPGYKTRGQALSNYKSKPYDIIHITTADGKDMDIYFDISNFYGKF
jgi:hypothetical protein